MPNPDFYYGDGAREVPNFSPKARTYSANPGEPSYRRPYYTREFLEKAYSKGSVKFACQLGLLNVPEFPLSVESRQEELEGIAEAFAILALQLGFKALVVFEPVEGLSDQ